VKLSKVLLIIVLFLLYFGVESLNAEQKRLKAEITIVSEEISEIKQSNAELRNMVEYFMEAQAEQESEY